MAACAGGLQAILCASYTVFFFQGINQVDLVERRSNCLAQAAPALHHVCDEQVRCFDFLTFFFVSPLNRKEAEQTAAELGVLHIHSQLEDTERRRRIELLKKGARCVATSAIGVGCNLGPKHVCGYGHT